ncbi:protein CapI [bacterium B13(2017)]|nr:protein CapI [bacterium B13(2017)]
MNNEDNILITGSAGFIGFSVSKTLLEQGYKIIGLDSLNPYYDVTLKHARNEILLKFPNYTFYHTDLCDLEGVKKVFKEQRINYICHLAAQAGVRYSLTHPFEYEKSNLQGFLHLIHEAQEREVKNFVYASSSSVYGANKKLPFSESDPVTTPISLYGATKRSNELIAYSYSHLFKLPCTGLRFFTVYGPWGRPDMALFIFTKSILEDNPIDVYNHGDMNRSFTYIDDIVQGVIACLKNPFAYEVFNLGNDKTRSLKDYIRILEEKLSKKAKQNMMPLQPGDVLETFADLTYVKEKIGFEPKTDIEEGIGKFVDWYKKYYNK